MEKEQWLLCPICQNKTRIKLREDTELKNFPLFCPKCRQETLINVKQLNTSTESSYFQSENGCSFLLPMSRKERPTVYRSCSRALLWDG